MLKFHRDHNRCIVSQKNHPIFTRIVPKAQHPNRSLKIIGSPLPIGFCFTHKVMSGTEINESQREFISLYCFVMHRPNMKFLQFGYHLFEISA
jgi:hypothetical protein